jgi:hypothetical protein
VVVDARATIESHTGGRASGAFVAEHLYSNAFLAKKISEVYQHPKVVID